MRTSICASICSALFPCVASAGDAPKKDVWPLRTDVWREGYEDIGQNNAVVIQDVVCGSRDGRPVSGVLVYYARGSRQEPKFTWDTAERKIGFPPGAVNPLMINGHEVEIADLFVLYVNDGDGLPVALTIGPHDARLFRDGEVRSKSKLLAFWKDVVTPRLEKEKRERSKREENGRRGKGRLQKDRA